MNISIDDFNAYLEGKLSEERNQSIDKYLKDNPAQLRALQATLEHQEKDDFSELLDALNQKLSPIIDPAIYTQTNEKNKKVQSFEFRRYIMPALSVAATGLILFFLMSNSLSSYESYLDSYPDIVTEAVRGHLPPDDLTLIEKGMISYNNGDMQVANNLYNEHLFSEPTDTKARFYRAITQLHLENPLASLNELELISTTGEIMQFADGVIWYKALSLVALERYSEAIPLLIKISKNKHYKSKEASRLLSEID